MIDPKLLQIPELFKDKRAKTAFELVGLEFGFVLTYFACTGFNGDRPVGFAFETSATDKLDYYMGYKYNLFTNCPSTNDPRALLNREINKSKDKANFFVNRKEQHVVELAENIQNYITDAVKDIIEPFVAERFERIYEDIKENFVKGNHVKTFTDTYQENYTSLNAEFVELYQQDEELRDQFIRRIEKAYIAIYYELWSTENHLLKHVIIACEKMKPNKYQGLTVLEVRDKDLEDVTDSSIKDDDNITSILLLYN